MAPEVCRPPPVCCLGIARGILPGLVIPPQDLPLKVSRPQEPVSGRSRHRHSPPRPGSTPSSSRLRPLGPIRAGRAGPRTPRCSRSPCRNRFMELRGSPNGRGKTRPTSWWGSPSSARLSSGPPTRARSDLMIMSPMSSTLRPAIDSEYRHVALAVKKDASNTSASPLLLCRACVATGPEIRLQPSRLGRYMTAARRMPSRLGRLDVAFGSYAHGELVEPLFETTL